MKNLLIIFALLPTFLFAQDERLLGLEKDSVLNDSGYYEIVYRLVDTIGEYETGNYYVKVTVLDSAQMVSELYNTVKGYYDRLGEFEGMKISALQQGKSYRDKASELTGSDDYRTFIIPAVRREMAGSYFVRYNGQAYRTNLLENGEARDAQNTLYFTHAPLSSTWSVVIDRQNANERIEIFKVRGDLWVGDGSKGRFILRRRR